MSERELSQAIDRAAVPEPWRVKALDAWRLLPQRELVAKTLIALLDRHAELFAEREGALERLLALAAQGDYPRRMLEQIEGLAPFVYEMAKEELVAQFKAPRELPEALDAKIRGLLPMSREQRLAEREAVMDALRLFKRRASMALYAREIWGASGVRDTTAALSRLAEATLQGALLTAAALCDEPALAAQVCVLAMGKLGGEELNYSSDVDLIFVCSAEVASRAERHEAAARVMRELVGIMQEVTSQGYVFRVDLRLRPEGERGALLPSAEALAGYYLSCGRTWERSAWLKARPVAGRLELGAQVLSALEPFVYRRYLDFSALDELRQMKAMIERNARDVTVLGSALPEEQEAQPTSAPKRPGAREQSVGASRQRFGARAGPLRRATTSARRRRRRVSAFKAVSASSATTRPGQPQPQQHEKPEALSLREGDGGLYGWDVKIGAGGIREIEFFVQALQLVHSGTRATLRAQGTLEALDRMLYSGLLSHEDYEALCDAYDFYRRVEHRVQMERDRQLHALPRSREAMEALACRMGFDLAAFFELLEGHRAAVRQRFEVLFEQSEQRGDRPTLERSVEEKFQALFVGAALPRSERLALLKEAGFEQHALVEQTLSSLAQRSNGPFSAAALARDRGEQATYLFGACAATPRPDQALRFLSRLITEVGSSAWFWGMLKDNPHAARLLIHVFGSSEPFAAQLVRDPNLVTRLLSASDAATDQSAGSMERELSASLKRAQNPDHTLGLIHRFQREQMLRLGLHQVGGAASTRSTARQLGDLAEIVVRAVLEQVWGVLRQSARLDEAPISAVALPFCVVGLGKLGGKELGFGSDLDVLFVCEPEPERGLTIELLARLAQRLVHALGGVSHLGQLYEVDTRLRPSGGQGALVVTCEALRSYHAHHADLWERQSLCRARALTGLPALRRQIGELRCELALRRAPPAAMRRTMANMRARMLEQAAVPAGRFDVKRSRGGLIDVEYLTQYMQCGGAAGLSATPLGSLDERVLRGEVLDPGLASQNTLCAVEALAKLACTPDRGEAWRALARDYEALRRVEMRLKLATLQGDAIVPREERDRRELARALGMHGEEAIIELERYLEGIRARVTAHVDRLMMA